MCSAIATQAIGDDAPGLLLQAGEQPLEEALRRSDVPAVLDQDVEHDAVLIDRTPEIVQLAIHLQDHLIEVPNVARLGPALTELVGEVGTKLAAPLLEIVTASLSGHRAEEGAISNWHSGDVSI
jgi:hypothetical protein